MIALRHAINGICYGFRTERHLQYHLFAAVTVFIIGFISELSLLKWMVLVLLVAAIFSAELMNTAIEAVVDLVSPDEHPLAKVAKDTAAGAVLVLSIGAVLIAILLFLSEY